MKTRNHFKCGSQDGYLMIHREWAEPTRAELQREISRLKSLIVAWAVLAVGALAIIFIICLMQ